jgi:hypothetical protein
MDDPAIVRQEEPPAIQETEGYGRHVIMDATLCPEKQTSRQAALLHHLKPAWSAIAAASRALWRTRTMTSSRSAGR